MLSALIGLVTQVFNALVLSLLVPHHIYAYVAGLAAIHGGALGEAKAGHSGE